MKLSRIILLLPLLYWLAGCGQPGPLYLPTEPKPVPATPDKK